MISLRQRWLFFVLLLGLSLGVGVQAQEDPAAQFARASSAFQVGRFGEAIQGFQAAAAGFEKQGNRKRQASALGNLTMALHATGNYRLAFQTLDQAMILANEAGDEALLNSLKGILGSLSTFSRKAKHAEGMLKESIAEARQNGNSQALAMLLHDYGVMWAGRGRLEEASKAFEETLELCDRYSHSLLRTKTYANQAMMYLNQALEHFELMEIRGPSDYYYPDYRRRYEQNLQASLESLTKARQGLGNVSAPYDKAILATTLGDCYLAMLEKGAANWTKTSEEAIALYQVAMAAGKSSANPLALSHALGSMGSLYEKHERFGDALALSRSARDLAQELSAPDLVFRWTWQVGRLLKALGETENAKKAYQVAQETLAPIRHDVAIGYGNRNLGRSFREAVGAFYFELAELLLEEDGTSQPTQEILRQARDVVESLKSAELEDYFQDECVNLALKKRKNVEEALDDSSAVIYTIPLTRGTAILVTIGDRIHFARTGTSGRDLNRQALRMRDSIVNPETFIDFQEPAQALYDTLIRPIKGLLESQNIRTLVFVPDGTLRTVPMAVLHDGEKYLLEEYAIAITPGLTLMEPRPIPEGDADVLVGALTVPRHGFPGLPYVRMEVEKIQAQATPTVLMNQSFLKNQLYNDVAEGSYKIVHIASHGEFQRDSGDSFFLTYDGKLTFNELEAMIRPKEFDENPVEMLCLSACKTALGDNRAALGLAGVAVKSGARSALATLWEVDDQTTSELMAQFYTELLQGKSRAEALRQAQLSVLRQDPEFETLPFYWAPFMIIGNWY